MLRCWYIFCQREREGMKPPQPKPRTGRRKGRNWKDMSMPVVAMGDMKRQSVRGSFPWVVLGWNPSSVALGQCDLGNCCITWASVPRNVGRSRHHFGNPFIMPGPEQTLIPVVVTNLRLAWEVIRVTCLPFSPHLTPPLTFKFMREEIVGFCSSSSFPAPRTVPGTLGSW